MIDENNNLRNTVNSLNTQIGEIKNYKNKITLLEQEINQKNIQIQNYQNNLNNQFNNQMNNQITNTIIAKAGEEIITVNFVSMGTQDVGHYSLPCRNTDLFVRLEEN